MIASFDTVSLGTSLFNHNFNDINNFIFNANDFDKNIKYKDNKITTTYLLKDNLKSNVIGLEKLAIFETKYNATDIAYSNRSLDFNIIFNAKILKDDYLQNINKTNIDRVYNTLLSELKRYIKLTESIINSLIVRSIDYTKNLLCSAYSSYDYVSTLSQTLTKTRSLFLYF